MIYLIHELHSTNSIFKFSKDNKPVLKIESGDTVLIHTCDCFADQIRTPEDKLEAMDWEKVNPATGPVYIEGAETGDVLKVTIENISINNQGVMAAGKDHGVLGKVLDPLSSKLITIDDNKAIFDDKLSFPLNPMIGVIGVAPDKEDINTGTPGIHGGNMDNAMIGAGAILYLPVFTKGALFALGDLHAVMGDGEIGVTGIEIAGKVNVRLEILKGLTLVNPILENNQHLTTIASKETLDEAVDTSTLDMFNLLLNKLPFEKNELAMLMSAVGHTQICQVVDPLKTARFVMPKWVLEKYNFNLH